MAELPEIEVVYAPVSHADKDAVPVGQAQLVWRDDAVFGYGWVLWFWRDEEVDMAFIGGDLNTLEWALVQARAWLELLAT